MRHRDFKQILTLPERLSLFAQRRREQAQAMSAGRDRDNILQKVRQAEAAIHIEDWLRLPAAAIKVKMPSPGVLVDLSPPAALRAAAISGFLSKH
jgi:hypothetical protein